MEEAKAVATYEGCGVPIWSATANWIPAADGSLSDVISYDTSEIENDQQTKPLLLLRPEEDDPPPCEITICFKKTHEIHRVYVRSTARVYEIYYSPDHGDNSEEYLCTVRCSAVEREMMPQDAHNDVPNGCWGNNNGTEAREDQVVRSDSNGSDEDGWVKIKLPDSPLLDDKEYPMPQRCDIGMDIPAMPIHYEATADISDYSPCISLKVRLLSIQTKACVRIEEIYVYADPVEPSNTNTTDSMGESMGRSSLLAMLVPSLMQLSKSRGGQDKCSSEEGRSLKYQDGSEKTAQTENSQRGKTAAQGEYSEKSPDDKPGISQRQTAIESKDARSEPIQEVTAPHQVPYSLADYNNCRACNRLEKVLDELVLKVGRVEAFCSKFEENMLKPLSCMEQRLQQLELKLDTLAAKTQSSEKCVCSRGSILESNEYDSKINDGNPDHTELREDAAVIATELLADEVGTSEVECQAHPGLVIKAPEFLNEDDDCSNNEDGLNPLMEDLPKQKNPLTIDSALASSLAAFLASSTIESPSPTLGLTGASQKHVSGCNSYADSLAVVPSEGIDRLSDESDMEDTSCDFHGSVMEGTCLDDSMLSSRDAGEDLSSDMENQCSSNLECITESITFDDSLLAADADLSSATIASLADSGFIVMASDFLNSSGSFNDDTLDSPRLEGLDHQTSIPTPHQRVPELAEFCSSTVLQSTKNVPALINAPRGFSSIGSNALLALTVAVQSEGADESGRDDHNENKMKDEVCLDSLPSMSAPSSERGHYDGLGLKEWLAGKKDDVPSAQNLVDGHALSDLNAGISQNCHGASGADGNDAEEPILHDFEQRDRELVGDSSNATSSCFENLGNQSVESDYQAAATTNDEIDPVITFEKAFNQGDLTAVTCPSTGGYSPGMPNEELGDMICDVKFTPERNWISGLPLEVLLGEVQHAKLLEPCTSSSGSNGNAVEQPPDYSSSAEERVCEADTVESFF